MGEMKHTPGPWVVTVRDRVGITVKAGDGRPIAEIWQNGHDPEANAALIAAAPDMLEALKRIVNPAPGVSQKAPAWVYGIARAALSKASPSEGGEA